MRKNTTASLDSTLNHLHQNEQISFEGMVFTPSVEFRESIPRFIKADHSVDISRSVIVTYSTFVFEKLVF